MPEAPDVPDAPVPAENRPPASTATPVPPSGAGTAGTARAGDTSYRDVGLHSLDTAARAATAEDTTDHERVLRERQDLIRLCLYALDRARSAGVAERIEEGLAAVGVTSLRPDGDRFDPARHEAGGVTDTDDPALAGTVAETEVVGFADRGRTLRVPVVTVYTRKGPG
ncbi:nucleotide exchange factor GrpE [Actinoalloteichus caeruleus]|uniref:nucleotide exchange factor GrpE n=1 Tax=Actinoalloteichus cyanogriseus TaxID=2893586 RepID=UPI0035586BCA